MKTLFVLITQSFAVTLLTACGSGSVPKSTSSSSASIRLPRDSQTFNYTGAAQSFVVPSGVTRLMITAIGANGEPQPTHKGIGGLGGLVKARIPVKPGEMLSIYVGGYGDRNGSFNGGGGVSGVNSKGWGGGGASDVREGGTELADRVVVAGGGGGAGHGAWFVTGEGGNGGAGGGFAGGAGGSGGGSDGYGGGGGGGGSLTSGGAGGASAGLSRCASGVGASGTLGTGGEGGYGGGYYTRLSGGGGGGGYYGGGGGGGGGAEGFSVCVAKGDGGGGGGGSSFVEKRATRVTNIQGYGTGPNNNGQISISW